MRSAFLHDPWVAGVDRIFIQGHRIVVLLSYREPVAIARFESNEPEIAVDAEGVLLDAKETDDSAADLTYLRYLSSPLKLEFGRKWMGNGSGRRESEPDPEVQRLVRLAAFLRRDAPRNQRSDERNPSSSYSVGNISAGYNAARICSPGAIQHLPPKESRG